MCFTAGRRFGSLFLLSALAWSDGVWWSVATRTVSATVPLHRLNWRTPALRDYVHRLKLNPTATARLRGPMLQRASTN